jgi:hypothetical protein
MKIQTVTKRARLRKKKMSLTISSHLARKAPDFLDWHGAYPEAPSLSHLTVLYRFGLDETVE